MIGGTDIIIEGSTGASAMDCAMRAIRLSWPRAVFENADGDEPAVPYQQVAYNGLMEVFAYKDDGISAEWDRLGADPSLDGTMIHLIDSGDAMTIVVDDRQSPEIQAIVESIRYGLATLAGRIQWRDAA